MLLVVYTTTRKRFVIFICRHFELSWNTTALSQSNCRNFSCSSINTMYITRILANAPGGVLPYIRYTGMCRPTGSWFWSSWFRTGYPFQRRFLEWGIKNCGSQPYLLLKIVADYEEAFIWCISRTNKEISFEKNRAISIYKLSRTEYKNWPISRTGYQF